MADSRARRVLFVSPHFPPDSSAGSHRARILVPHLATHGWEPVVLTVDAAAIDGRSDPALLESIPPSIRVVRAPTVAVRRARAAGVGDLGLRALRGLYCEGRTLFARERFDAVLITTYPIYPAWLGPRFKSMSRVPFVLDLQDPWVGAWGRTVGPGGLPDLRSRLSRRVAVTLERSIAPRADAFMAVSTRTLDELALRVPGIRTRPMIELPIGWEPSDFTLAKAILAPSSPVTTLSYVGTLLPVGHAVARALLRGAQRVLEDASTAPFTMQFVGTSNQTQYEGAALLTGLIPSGLEHAVREYPERVPYFDAIRALCSSDVVLVLGTEEPHYTASKVYPALASGRPVLALLHKDSQAASVLRDASGTVLVTFDTDTTPEELTTGAAAGLRRVLTLVGRSPFDRASILDRYRGDRLAARLATFLDAVTARVEAEAPA